MRTLEANYVKARQLSMGSNAKNMSSGGAVVDACEFQSSLQNNVLRQRINAFIELNAGADYSTLSDGGSTLM
ncbi:hypothetical protein V6N12_069733 [Hibiscus sabdariffa]|uniref:Uncharacterized protein n=1 Tax=Hibiscus sabdariffa TaxID=183260 RepID=A0ABR2FER6_9ROSI